MTVKTVKNKSNNRDNNIIQKLLRSVWQGRQGSNLRLSVLETDTLPAELLPYCSATTIYCTFATELKQFYIFQKYYYII